MDANAIKRKKGDTACDCTDQKGAILLLKKLLKLSGLKDRSANQLRHAFAPLHIAAGENGLSLWVAEMKSTGV